MRDYVDHRKFADPLFAVLNFESILQRFRQSLRNLKHFFQFFCFAPRIY